MQVCRFKDQSYLRYQAHDLNLTSRAFLFLQFWYKMVIMLQIKLRYGLFARACQGLAGPSINASRFLVKRIRG